MTQVIIYQTDEGMHVVTPIGDLDLVMKRDIPPNVNAKLINSTILPKDTTFMPAWEWKETYVEINMDKAREVWRNYIRSAREPLYAQNDITLRDAILENSDYKRNNGLKLRDDLRNAPQDGRINAAQTPEDLKKVWPECLGKNPFEA